MRPRAFETSKPEVRKPHPRGMRSDRARPVHGTKRAVTCCWQWPLLVCQHWGGNGGILFPPLFNFARVLTVFGFVKHFSTNFHLFSHWHAVVQGQAKPANMAQCFRKPFSEVLFFPFFFFYFIFWSWESSRGCDRRLASVSPDEDEMRWKDNASNISSESVINNSILAVLDAMVYELYRYVKW